MIVVGLTFLFGLRNVTTLDIHLGVPTYIAILVAPAVDLSVIALGARHLTLYGGPAGAVRSAPNPSSPATTANLVIPSEAGLVRCVSSVR
ncbi:conserved hypothetical protein [Frankia sp. Hr75.2]|nr:conserved hypothetical protein [Frankia sp. Hr75.2]